MGFPQVQAQPDPNQEIDQELARGAFAADVYAKMRQKYPGLKYEQVLDRESQFLDAEDAKQQPKSNLPGTLLGLGLGAASNYPMMKSGGSIAKGVGLLDILSGVQANSQSEGLMTPTNVGYGASILGGRGAEALGAKTQGSRIAPLIQAGYGGLEGAATAGLPGLADPNNPEVNKMAGTLGGILGLIGGAQRGRISRGGNRSATNEVENWRNDFKKLAENEDVQAWEKQQQDMGDVLKFNDDVALKPGVPGAMQANVPVLDGVLELTGRTGMNPLAFTPRDTELMRDFAKTKGAQKTYELLDSVLGPGVSPNMNMRVMNERIEKVGEFLRMSEKFQGPNAKKNIAGTAAGYFLKRYSNQRNGAKLGERVGQVIKNPDGTMMTTDPMGRKLAEEIFSGTPKAYEKLVAAGQAFERLQALKNLQSRASVSSGGSFWLNLGDTVHIMSPDKLAEAILQGKTPILESMADVAERYVRDLMKNPMAKGDIHRAATRELARLADRFGMKTKDPDKEKK